MSNRPTIADLARTAGVSTATVDRVLSGRTPVRPETARKVHDAARAIGFHAADLIGRRVTSDLPALTVGVVLGPEREGFAQAMRPALEAAAAEARGVVGRVVIAHASGADPAEHARLIDAMAGRVDALAAIAVDHPEVTAAVERLTRRGTPVFALCSDFGRGFRRDYIGLDNQRMGRVAAHILRVTTPEEGPLAVVTGGQRWNGAELRETGCRSYLRECASGHRLRDLVVAEDGPGATERAVGRLLAAQPDLVGLYCAGGDAEGAIAAVRAVRPERGLRLVVHELTEVSRRALADHVVDLVIATPVEALCRALFAQAAGAVMPGDGAARAPGLLTPQLFLPEAI
ncbi:LacI family DNA-binding transcriptional regulator [Jannaschia marina]|uniref:LacI family DNA-binding transcriptional regulator n=1 Tax=Jannaschia marina TaxID=2741674 RepID=UPI0015CE6AC5|nr:LacI family DNA-binding transcriptional regulator [Jannaschia marina]